MLTPGVSKELTEEIDGLVSARYAKEPGPDYRPAYTPIPGKIGFDFASLPRRDRLDLILEHVSWRHYEDKGIG